MSKCKGVSADEKRTRMLQLFYEKKDFFQLKDLEKIAPKEKGIIAQSVKDVVQSLVDDGLVDTDKIGSSVYFWAYPSKAKHMRKRKLEDITNRLNENSKKLKTVEEALKQAKNDKQDSGERANILKELEELTTEENSLSKELQKYKDNDPEILENMKSETKFVKEAINRWTDNIDAIRTWAKTKFLIEPSVLNKQFGIPEELEYVDT